MDYSTRGNAENLWFHYDEMHLSAYSLHLHLEDRHLVTFCQLQNLNNIVNSDLSTKSMLIEIFVTNQVNQDA